MKTRTLKEIVHVLEKAERDLLKMEKDYPVIYEEEFTEIKNSVMTKWYAQYEPFFYDRTGGLKDACKIEFKGSKYTIDFGYEYMDNVYNDYKNRDIRQYIYENSFVEGYHGGANDAKVGEFNGMPANPHPSPGVPYYKEFPTYTFWARPAIRSFSPYYKMYGSMVKKKKELDNERKEKLDKIINRVKRTLNRL